MASGSVHDVLAGVGVLNCAVAGAATIRVVNASTDKAFGVDDEIAAMMPAFVSPYVPLCPLSQYPVMELGLWTELLLAAA